MAVEVDIVYQGQLHCDATHGPSGNTIHTDAPTDNGGKGEAFSPTDLVGTALATCIVTIMGLVADRNKLDIAGTRLHVVKEMVADPFRRIGTLTVTLTFPSGRNFTDDDRRRLENAAETCPVKRSLAPNVNVVLNYEYPE